MAQDLGIFGEASTRLDGRIEPVINVFFDEGANVDSYSLSQTILKELEKSPYFDFVPSPGGVTRITAPTKLTIPPNNKGDMKVGFQMAFPSGSQMDYVVSCEVGKPEVCGRAIKLRFDDGKLESPHLLDKVLATERQAVWSGVTIGRSTSFATLHLWFASFLDGFCRIAADDGISMTGEGESWFPFGAVRADSFAYLVVRPASDGVEFGALAYGLHAEEAGRALVEQIQAWDELARSGPAPTFAVWPIDTDHSEFPERTGVVAKDHSLITISWPVAG